jgi:hypothetical protein
MHSIFYWHRLRHHVLRVVGRSRRCTPLNLLPIATAEYGIFEFSHDSVIETKEGLLTRTMPYNSAILLVIWQISKHCRRCRLVDRNTTSLNINSRQERVPNFLRGPWNDVIEEHVKCSGIFWEIKVEKGLESIFNTPPPPLSGKIFGKISYDFLFSQENRRKNVVFLVGPPKGRGQNFRVYPPSTWYRSACPCMLIKVQVLGLWCLILLLCFHVRLF